MAKLPARQKINVLCFRRAAIDEVLVVEREVRRMRQWGLPSIEGEEQEPAREAALRLAAHIAGARPVADHALPIVATYRVKDGPRAGEWTERFHAVEIPPEHDPREGAWLTHYDAKAAAGAEAPRVREAFSALRELVRLKP